MQADPLDAFAALVAQRISWDQHERDVAEWSVWLEVRATLGAYVPAPPPFASAEVVALSKLELDDAKRELYDTENAKLAFAFGTWRAVVTEHEAMNARRLYALAQMVHSLSASRMRASRPEVVDQALAHLGDWIASVWRTDVPLQGDIRTWSSRMTRRPDLLPFAWREL